MSFLLDFVLIFVIPVAVVGILLGLLIWLIHFKLMRKKYLKQLKEKEVNDLHAEALLELQEYNEKNNC